MEEDGRRIQAAVTVGALGSFLPASSMARRAVRSAMRPVARRRARLARVSAVSFSSWPMWPLSQRTSMRPACGRSRSRRLPLSGKSRARCAGSGDPSGRQVTEAGDGLLAVAQDDDLRVVVLCAGPKALLHGCR